MFKKILVPTDGSDLATSAATTAAQLAKSQGAQVVGVYVIDPFPYIGIGDASAVALQAYLSEAKSAAGKALDALSFAPMAIPPIVLVLAILLIYLRTPLYGTLWVIIIAHSTVFLAFGVRTMSSALLQLHSELPDAALVSGASWLTTLHKVTLPLVWPQFVNGWLWVFAHSARDLTAPLMLLSSTNVVAAAALWNMWQFPDLPGVAALSVLLMGALMVIVLPFQIYAARRLDAG